MTDFVKDCSWIFFIPSQSHDKAEKGYEKLRDGAINV